MNQKKGFSLLELLVVVLIIGVLASYATVSYKNAVEMSRVAEAKVVLATMRKAQLHCVMKYGGNARVCCGEGANGGNLFDNSVISLFKSSSYACPREVCGPKNRDWAYQMGECYIYAYRLKDDSYSYYLNTTALLKKDPVYNRIGCQDHDYGKKGFSCEKIGFTKMEGWNFFEE